MHGFLCTSEALQTERSQLETDAHWTDIFNTNTAKNSFHTCAQSSQNSRKGRTEIKCLLLQAVFTPLRTVTFVATLRIFAPPPMYIPRRIKIYEMRSRLSVSPVHPNWCTGLCVLVLSDYLEPLVTTVCQ